MATRPAAPAPAPSADPTTAKTPVSVDESLWWDPFDVLLAELEKATVSSAPPPPSLVNKLKMHRAWLLKSITMFRPPSQASKSALEAGLISVGSRRLEVRPEVKEVALEFSAKMLLDEVQSYILVTRYMEQNNMLLEFKVQNFLQLILLQYFLERQCLLKCTRQIIIYSLHVANQRDSDDAILEVTLQLFSDGLEKTFLSIVEDLFSCKDLGYMEVDLATLWVEQSLLEANLVLDSLFLAYYETFCTCKREPWKSLCSLFKGIISNSLRIGKLAVSVVANNLLYQAKVQLLLILIETLDLDSLLHMVHDGVPFRQDEYVFSVADIQEIDVEVSSLNILEAPDVGLLFIAWAVLLCLLSSLPEKHDKNLPMEIDHAGYVCRAFEAAPLSYLLEILDDNVLRDSDCSHMGYKSVMKTLISAFIASYEISNQLEDNTSHQLVDVLCKIYRGEESLCVQFWDRDSFVDGPIRSFLCSLENEFPFRTVELVCLLSALCEGAWPAECVYNFLDKMCGLTSSFEISSSEDCPKIVETSHPFYISGFDGLKIPSQTCGQVLKLLDGNIALVRWQHMQSGIYVLLLRLTWGLHRNSYEEVYVILDLLHRLMSMNMALCFALMNISNSVEAGQMNGHMEEMFLLDIVKIICSLISNLGMGASSVGLMSLCISILSKLLHCSPLYVVEVAQRTNILDLGTGGYSSGAWMLSGGLAKMLLIDCEQNDDCCSLTTSVLDFTGQLVDAGVEDDRVHSLLVFSLQYVFVNHVQWKFKKRHARWKVTLKGLELMKKCISFSQASKKQGVFVRDVLICDSSIHDTLFRVMCVTTPMLEGLYISRQYEWKEIEGLQLAIASALDTVYTMLSYLSKDFISDLSVFHRAVVSSATKPMPVPNAVMSLISFFRCPDIQMAAARVLSTLCYIADKVRPSSLGDIFLMSDEAQIRRLSSSIHDILHEKTIADEDLSNAIVQLFTSAAIYQPPLLLALFLTNGNVKSAPINGSDMKGLLSENRSGPLRSTEKLLELLMQHVRKSNVLIQSSPRLLLNILYFVKALWQGSSQYMCILEIVKASENFWRNMLSILDVAASKKDSLGKLRSDQNMCLAYEYQCQAAVLDIVAHEIFLQKKMLQDEKSEETSTAVSENNVSCIADIDKAKSDSLLHVAVSSWIGGSGIEELVKFYSSCEYDRMVLLRAKTAICICIVHVMLKLAGGDAGSISVSLVEKIRDATKKLSGQPMFMELLMQYSLRGYSEDEELGALILNDLFYHLQGELDGRDIAHGPFKELSTFLLHVDIFQKKDHKFDVEFMPPDGSAYLFDSRHIEKSLGLKCWDHSKWEAFKEIAESMLLHICNANNMVFYMDSKNSALKALNSFLAIYLIDINKKPAPVDQEMKEKVAESCINHLLDSLQATSILLIPSPDLLDNILKCLKSQEELLLFLTKYLFRQISSQPSIHQYMPIFVHVIKASGNILGLLIDVKPSTPEAKETVKLLLTLLLMSVEYCFHSDLQAQSVEPNAFSEVSLACLGILPILCNCAETVEYCNLALSAIDIMLKAFLTSNTWLPVLQKHLKLQNVILKLQAGDSFVSISVILKFFLTLARTQGGAKLLQSVNFFSSLKRLFALLLVEKSLAQNTSDDGLAIFGNKEKAENIWGLGLSIVTATIHSLADGSSCADIVENMILYFFVEKANMISHYLSAPNLPGDDQNKKRARSQEASTSLNALVETEHTLQLICTLAKHQTVWSKTMKEMDSSLREQTIHLLSFISKVGQRIGDGANKAQSVLRLPVFKEEVLSCGKSQLIDSKHGWFSLSALDSTRTATVSAVPGTSLIEASQTREIMRGSSKIYFLNSVALLMYKIAYLLLKFLCLQAKAATKRAEEVGFIDLAHYPELPMPEILHGLQDQCMAIVTEVCIANKGKVIQTENQAVCLLLLQIMEKALYLELCVSQICEIRPVLGRVEDFSKGIKVLFRVAEDHSSLKALLKSLGQILPLLYPNVLPTDGVS